MGEMINAYNIVVGKPGNRVERGGLIASGSG
jgi:hypothetical protein